MRISSMYWVTVLLLLSPNVCFSQSSESDDGKGTVSLVVDGKGATDGEAIKDALRSAVRQACGSFVLGETLIKGDEILRDNTYQVTDGVVSSYRELATQRDKSTGIITKKVRVVVEKRRLMSNMSGSTNNSQDGKKLFSALIDKRDKETGGRDLLITMLRSFPEVLMEGEISGDTRLVDTDQEHVGVQNDIKVRISPRKYAEFTDKIDQVLRRICSDKGFVCFDALSVPPSLYNDYRKKIRPAFLGDEVLVTPESHPPIHSMKATTDRENWWTKSFNSEKEAVVLLNTKSNSMGYTEWRWFHVPKIYLINRPFTMSMRFERSAGDTLVSDNINIGPNVPGLNVTIRPIPYSKSNGGRQATQIILSPYFMAPPLFQDHFMVQRIVHMKPDYMRQINRVAYQFYDTSRGPDSLQAMIKETEAETPSSSSSSDSARMSGRTDAPSADSSSRSNPRLLPRTAARGGF